MLTAIFVIATWRHYRGGLWAFTVMCAVMADFGIFALIGEART